MNPPNPQTRQRIVAGAADMIRRRGLNATSVRELAKHAKAPLGSTYHYFPDGKQQLAAEAVGYAGDTVASRLRRELEAGPAHGLGAFLALWHDTLVSTDFRAGCPVLAVAIEDTPGENPSTARTAAANTFATWESLLADSLKQHGVAEGQAEQLATLIVASVEGAVVMCRARRDTRPLENTAAQLDSLLRATMGESHQTRPNPPSDRVSRSGGFGGDGPAQD